MAGRSAEVVADLLDEQIPVMPGCEIHDDPLAPLCAACRARIREQGDETAISWLPREARYVEKLATPDVTIADMIGDLDPIKAARSGLDLADELVVGLGAVVEGEHAPAEAGEEVGAQGDEGPEGEL